MVNLNAMQVMASADGDRKMVRRYPADTNIKQMSMGSWRASLSKGGQARGLTGITHGPGNVAPKSSFAPKGKQ